MPTETDYAWAAGIIDGEGSISMNTRKPGVMGNKTTTYQFRLSVIMVDEPTIMRLQGIFGGVVKPRRATHPERHRPTFEWYVHDVFAERALKKALQYMTTKREHALLVISYRENCLWMKAGRGNPCPDHIIAMRLDHRDRLRKLNARGVAKSP